MGTVLSPGPQYNPAETTGKYLNTSSSFSFGPSDEMRQVAEFNFREQQEKLARKSKGMKSVYAQKSPSQPQPHEQMNAKVWKQMRTTGKSPAKSRDMGFY